MRNSYARCKWTAGPWWPHSVIEVTEKRAVVFFWKLSIDWIMAWLTTVGQILVLCNLLITAHGNGTIAEPGQFPFHVSLQNSYSNEHMCSGVIIGNEWILTVGHCVEELAHVGELRAVVGTTKSKSDGVPYKIRSVTIHPQYRKSIARQHDIAMLRTKTKMKFNKKVNAIKLSPQLAIVDEDMVVSGWGMSKVSSSPFTYCNYIAKMFQSTPKPIRNSNFSVPTQRQRPDGISFQWFDVRTNDDNFELWVYATHGGHSYDALDLRLQCVHARAVWIGHMPCGGRQSIDKFQERTGRTCRLGKILCSWLSGRVHGNPTAFTIYPESHQSRCFEWIRKFVEAHRRLSMIYNDCPCKLVRAYNPIDHHLVRLNKLTKKCLHFPFQRLAFTFIRSTHDRFAWVGKLTAKSEHVVEKQKPSELISFVGRKKKNLNNECPNLSANTQ